MSFPANVHRVFRLIQNPVCIGILGIVLLSVVSFLNVPISNDEGVWGYIGRAWADDHILPYSGVADNKTPGIFYLNYISYSLFGTNTWFPRLIALGATVLTALFMYLLVRRVANKRAAILSMALFVLLMPLPAVDGSYALTETFMNLFVIAAFYFLNRHLEQGTRYRAVVLSGLCLGFGIAFRQSALISILPLVFNIAFLEKYDLKRSLRASSLFLFGVGTATILSILPYVLGGGGISAYLQGAWLFFLQGDVGVITGGILHRLSGFVTRFFIPEMFFLGSSVLLFCVYFRKIKSSGFLFSVPLLVWVFSDFFSYNLEGTYFPHHLKLLALSWSVCFGIVTDFFLRTFFREDTDTEPNSKSGVIIVALMVFFVLFQTNYYGTVRAFLRDVRPDHFRDMGFFVEGITKPGDTIYVHGLHTGPIYYYASRNSPSRYFETQQLALPGALNELQAELALERPEIILTLEDDNIPVWLSAFVSDHYQLLGVRDGYSIFQDKAPPNVYSL